MRLCLLHYNCYVGVAAVFMGKTPTIIIKNTIFFYYSINIISIIIAFMLHK